MKLAIMQPYFMPYIGYFQAIYAVDKYILFDNVNYSKNVWINRNRLLMRDGAIVTTTVPLKGRSSFSKICELEIDNRQPWKGKYLKTVQKCYGKRPYFKEVFRVLLEMLEPEYELLRDLNNNTIVAIAHFLDIKTEIDYDISRFSELEEDLDNFGEGDDDIHYYQGRRPDRKVARIIEMCRMEGCDEYYNAIGGQSLYFKEEFMNYGIRLNFIKTNDFDYNQDSKSGEFVPNLSIIDVLMNNGKEGTKRLLQEYTLI